MHIFRCWLKPTGKKLFDRASHLIIACWSNPQWLPAGVYHRSGVCGLRIDEGIWWSRMVRFKDSDSRVDRINFIGNPGQMIVDRTWSLTQEWMNSRAVVRRTRQDVGWPLAPFGRLAHLEIWLAPCQVRAFTVLWSSTKPPPNLQKQMPPKTMPRQKSVIWHVVDVGSLQFPTLVSSEVSCESFGGLWVHYDQQFRVHSTQQPLTQ